MRHSSPAPPSYSIDFGDLALSIWRHRARSLPGAIVNGTLRAPSVVLKSPCLLEHVMITPEATWTETSIDVLTGHARVAEAIVDAWLDENPIDVGDGIVGWISENLEGDIADRDWLKRWKAELAAAPAIAAALKLGPDELFERAGLTKFQRLAMSQLASGKTPKEIAFSVGITPDAARSRIDDARQKMLSLGHAQEAVA